VAQLDFYANRQDMFDVIDYMFDLSPMRLFEANSIVDQEIMEFKSSKELSDYLKSLWCFCQRLLGGCHCQTKIKKN
jgi:hypothetical protein